MAASNSTRTAKQSLQLTKQEEKLVRLFKGIPSKIERRAFIILAESIALGRFTR